MKKEKRTVLLSIFRDERGGMQGSVCNTAQVLSDLGWQTQILSLYGDGSKDSGLAANAICLETDEQRPVDLQRLQRTVEEVAPDLMINFQCPYIHRLDLGCPVVERVAMLSPYLPDSLPDIVTGAPHLVALVGQTRPLEAILGSLALERGLPARWIPNFVALRPAPSCGERRMNVVSIARHSPQKNLAALCSVARACPNIQFDLVTNVPLPGAPANLRVLVGLSEAEIDDVLARSGLYLNLSHKEGISNATLRAFAHALPAILTDGDGIVHHLQGNAWVVDTFALLPTNAHYEHHLLDIAHWIEKLAADAPLRCWMGQGSRRVAADFSREMVQEKWHQLLEKISK